MDDQERNRMLEQWIRPSSNDEVTQQERALRMVTEAIEASDLADVSHRIYAKGSYANQTNVRRDSDVDIAVDCHDCMYYDSFDDVAPKVAMPAYKGAWSGLAWRTGVQAALKAKFGSELDTSGSVAFHLPEVAGSRPNIDVVPGFHYRKYRNSSGSSFYDGSQVFPKTGPFIINWPEQQLKNGEAKDVRTGGRYKQFARALKSAENRLLDQGKIDDKPSYMMECLMYNVADDTLSRGTLVGAFRGVLLELWTGITTDAVSNKWLEPNERKFMFHSSRKWTKQDAKEVVVGAWGLLAFE